MVELLQYVWYSIIIRWNIMWFVDEIKYSQEEMKMKKCRLISIILCLTLIMSCVSISVAAVTFNDVDNDPTVSWAKDSITKMTDAGYIKGYEDGTFRPYNAITKIECLILMSRMLGFENSEFDKTVENAVDMYSDVVKKYNTTYPEELSYLLYCGVLKESELVDYASSANANTQLLRYQAAMLMAKLLGADKEAKAYSVASPTYSDNVAIPQSARPYVEYVTANGIMNGMTAADGEQAQFSPVTTLTRSQMATLLARMMDKMDVQYVSGTVEDASDISIYVSGKNYSFNDSAKIYVDGELASGSDIADNTTAYIVEVCGKALVVEGNAGTKETKVIYGIVKSRNESSNGKKITIADYENTSDTAEYNVADGCTVVIKASKANFADLSVNDFVRLVLTGSKVTNISVEETSDEVEGTLVEAYFDEEDHVFFDVSDSQGNTATYVASSKGVSVKRDGETVEVKDLSSGDAVTLKLSYGKVTKITAEGKTESFSGLLSEIIISNEPKVTIVSNGKSTTYKLRSNVEITVAGAKADIYSLRPNISVTGKLDSNEVKTLSASSISTNEDGQFTGTVTGKNTTYKVINIKDDNGNAQSIYYNSATTFLNSSGISSSVKSIETGSKLSVTGAYKNGIFEATIIIIK